MPAADKYPRGSDRRDFPDHRVDGAGVRTGGLAQAVLVKSGWIWKGMESRRDIVENLVSRFLGILCGPWCAAAPLKERRRILEKELDFLTACRDALRMGANLWLTLFAPRFATMQ